MGKTIGRYVLDTLQIFFPWDDALYTHLKVKGFGSSGDGKKALPLIYTDNCESTVSKKELQRKYVLRPSYFGKTYEELGWKQTKSETEPIIPAEKPLLEVLIEKGEENPKIRFRFIPIVKGKGEYHLEFSSMSAFGKIYSNWVAFYLPPVAFKEIIAKTEGYVGKTQASAEEVKIEKKQQQREEMDYIKTNVLYYVFCLAGFPYLVDYLGRNGISGNKLPCLEYDSNDSWCKQKMAPFIKLGVVHTGDAHGFMERKPQIVLKIAQPKSTEISRDTGQIVIGKVKGKIVESGSCESYLLVDAKEFLENSKRLLNWFETKYKTTI